MEKDPGEFRKGLFYGTFGTGIIMLLAFEYGGPPAIPDGEVQEGYVSLRDAAFFQEDFDGDGALETILRIKQTPFEVREQYDAEGNLVLPRRNLQFDNQENNAR